MNRKLPAILLLLLVVILSVSAWFVPEDKGVREHGASSSAHDGRRGLVLLLQGFDFDAQRFEKRPGALPTRPGMVWLARLPAGVEAATSESTETSEAETKGATPLREALLQGLSNPRHYRRFAAQGGSVLAEISGASDLSRLAGDFGFFEIEHLGLEPRPQDGHSTESYLRCSWITGEALELGVTDALAFTGLVSIPRVNVLVGDEATSALIVEVPIGRGSLVLSSCGAIFDNSSVAVRDHAVLAVRLAERASHGGTIWIDESNGLGGDTPTLFSLALEPRALPFTVAVVLFALFFVWRSFFAREIPRDPPPIEFMSPRTRALARARLFQRARRFDLLAEQLRRGSVRQIGEASRIPPAVCAEALKNAEGARRFARAIEAEAEAERWVDALVALPVASARDLVRLDSELRDLEDRLESRVRRVPSRRGVRQTTLTRSK